MCDADALGLTMAIHEAPLIGRETVAEGTMAFRFAKPVGFAYHAGQSMLVTLIDPPETDGEGESRTFTIASAPHDSDLVIATRMRDTAFKRVLKAASLGTKFRLNGPDGQMVLHDDASRPAVFLAGGIGITPFRAMARCAAHRRLPHRLYLFYSNRHAEDAAFLDELRQLELTNRSYHLIATITAPQRSSNPWSGETGFLSRQMLERHLSDLMSPIYYFAGPPAMTGAMQQMLNDTGIVKQAMHYEEFYGY